MRYWILMAAAVLACGGAGFGKVYEAKVPLLTERWVGGRWVGAVNDALAGAVHLEVDGRGMDVRVDPGRLPRDTVAGRKVLRVFVGEMSPEATAAQERRFGLSMPVNVDESRRMVVLVHGLDSDRANWVMMAGKLAERGYQVAYFTYPSDGPIDEAAGMFEREMVALRETFPGMKVDVVAHSMGALVARDYIEGEGYRGGVGHLVMLAPPNHGSPWAGYRVALEVREHWNLWRHDADWRPSWVVTDGLGEAGGDLRPGSGFLKKLNARERREGVKYTIVAGNQNPAWWLAGDCLERSANWIPAKVRGAWGVRRVYAEAEGLAGRLKRRVGKDDGPVSVRSARLAGVEDFVVVEADHCGVQMGEACAEGISAWEVVVDRLGR